MGECYICIEGDGKLSRCNCKNMYIHDECLLELISKTNTSKCSICKEEFKNVNILVKRKRNLTLYGQVLIVFILLNVTVGGTFIYNGILYIKNENSLYLSTFIFFVIISVIIISTTGYIIILRRDREIMTVSETRRGIINEI